MQQSTFASIRPVLIGISLTMVLLAGLAYIANSRRNSESIPQLTITAPLNGAPADSPLQVRFTSSAPISLRPNGWGSGNLHVHARVNGSEIMPAANDIRAQGDEYVWTIVAARRGPVKLRLGWADLRHQELPDGTTDTVAITLH